MTTEELVAAVLTNPEALYQLRAAGPPVLGPWEADDDDTCGALHWRPGMIRRDVNGDEYVYAGTLGTEPRWSAECVLDEQEGTRADADAHLREQGFLLCGDRHEP